MGGVAPPPHELFEKSSAKTFDLGRGAPSDCSTLIFGEVIWTVEDAGPYKLDAILQ